MGNSNTKTLDYVFGNKEDIILLIKQNQWENAAQYGDPITYKAVINNEDWFWKQVDAIQYLDLEVNSCSYGNIAMAVHYGSKYPDRMSSIIHLKTLLNQN